LEGVFACLVSNQGELILNQSLYRCAIDHRCFAVPSYGRLPAETRALPQPPARHTACFSVVSLV
jgi:hypothetical protein